MRKTSPQRWQISELLLPISVFLILVWYTYGILFVAPYPGFIFTNSDGRVVTIYSTSEKTPTLQQNDVLVQIGLVTWESYKRDARVMLFDGIQPGEIVPITVNRNGETLTIPWKFSGFDPTEFKTRFLNIWGLAFIFWFFGTAAQLLIRPKDGHQRLFIAANYLTALWLIFGSLSSFQLWESSILLHAVTWLLLPIYLHLHWVFPRPLKELPKTVWTVIYLIGFAFAAAEILQILPKSLYALAFLAALLGSIILEGTHYVRQADKRRDVSLLATSIFVAFFPAIIFGILVVAGTAPTFGPATLFSMPFMPLAYFYVIYRRQSGGLEVRLNRLISLYSFLIFLGTVLFSLIVPITSLDISLETSIFIGVLVILAATSMAIITFPIFQAFVEKRYLGIKLPYQNLQETYSNRITASTSLSSLLRLLDDEVFPSLLVRQFAFMHASDSGLKTLLSKNVTASQLPDKSDIDNLVSQAGMYIPIFSTSDEWMRLILPLKVGDSFIGFWLLGRRDPDDHYPQAELPILQSLANQTAIALSNILQTGRLQKLYEDDIARNEKSRLKLALDLHDSVLNQLAILRLSVDDAHVSPNFQEAYDEVTRRLREIVTDLRPPMLSYGLKLAIEELADNLMERSKDTVNIVADLQTKGEVRYAENIEQHLYRIAQEACENAIRHANAANIRISGLLNPQKITLKIEDDGMGFDIGEQLELDTLLASNHFGLAGIVERVHLIGGEIGIHFTPQVGTIIQIAWNYIPKEN